MYLRVSINIPSDKTFIYSVPKTHEMQIATGKRVLIPFGKRKLTGYILEVIPTSTLENIRDIIDILDFEPLFNEDDLNFYQWASRYYIHPLGKTLSEILPGGIDLKSNRWITPAKGKSHHGIAGITAFQAKMMDTLAHFPNGLSINRLKNVTEKKDLHRDLHALQCMEMIYVEDRIEKPSVILKKEKVVTIHQGSASSVKLTQKQQELIDFLRLHGASSFTTLRKWFHHVPALIRALGTKGLIYVTEEESYRYPARSLSIGKDESFILPNEDQKLALQEIERGLESNRFSPYLLHGVTGSGKTEVYLNAIEKTLQMKGGIIFLVPEIALTAQLLTRINQRFPDQKIALLHSGISTSARYDQWRSIQHGDIGMVVGARSALFAPVKNLKLIIVDEEHDTSYKQDDRLRYNARDLSIMKAKLFSATVVLGSATPAVQTYFNTMKGKYQYLILPSRVEERPLPKIEIIDMKQEVKKNGKDSFPILSRALRGAIEETLKGRKQTLLFLNRRGFHTFMFCPDCGYVFKCLNCAVSMTHHAGAGTLKCHYCDSAVETPDACPECRKTRIMQHGVGTERLEEEIKHIFPETRVGRMDSDTMHGKGAHEKILQSLDRQEIDILVGTQMITKGHDFHNITLVGVISADTSLNFPDFRAAERTFQLLTQASGRGGRGVFPGRVIIQTVNPDHYAITRARDHDYLGFYGDELLLRKTLSYPPYSRMVNLQLSSVKKDNGMNGAEKLKRLVKELVRTDKLEKSVDIIGPAESPIAKIKGRYRWQMLLKGNDSHALNRLTRQVLSKAGRSCLDIRVDVDPINFM